MWICSSGLHHLDANVWICKAWISNSLSGDLQLLMCNSAFALPGVQFKNLQVWICKSGFASRDLQVGICKTGAASWI